VVIFFIILFLISMAVGLAILFFRNKEERTSGTELTVEKNPLEFKVAVLFALLFVAFSFLTWFVLDRYGQTGLNVLSYLVGLTDIDPFLINLFQGKYKVGVDAIAVATLQAIVSNNVLKLVYACFFSAKRSWLMLIVSFAVIIAANMIVDVILM